jgi:serine/threonine-protein kinase 24/25/MST4
MAWDNGTIKSDWNFDTVKSTAAMGSFRHIAKDLTTSSEGEIEEEDASYVDDDGLESIDTSGAVKGSDPLVNAGLAANSAAAHSTVIIKPAQLGEKPERIPPELTSTPEETTDGLPSDALGLGAPPAYSGSVRSNRRTSYNGRTAPQGSGTVLREADIGTGIDTIRPIKRVDPVGSLRLSAEFVGNMRREGSNSTPTSPTSSNKRGADTTQAGRAMVDEIILPVLRTVR